MFCNCVIFKPKFSSILVNKETHKCSLVTLTFYIINMAIESTDQIEEKSSKEEGGDDLKVVIKEAKAAAGVSINNLMQLVSKSIDIDLKNIQIYKTTNSPYFHIFFFFVTLV